MEILIPVVAVTVIGLLAAGMLVAASKFMAVPVDEKFTQLRECLPGANCGACGYAGCDGYAQALSEGGVKPNLCVPGGAGAAAKVAAILGVEAGDVETVAAFVACQGGCVHSGKKCDYAGIPTCAAVNLMFAGDGACSYGCLGYGDCAHVCPNQTITVIDGLARVIPPRCSGCGLCVKTCPNHLIRLLPASQRFAVSCSSEDKGVITKKACSTGCIGCKKCEKTCPNGAISVVNNLARMDPARCTQCGACAEVCPTGALRTLVYPAHASGS